MAESVIITNKSQNPHPEHQKNTDFGGYEVRADLKYSEKLVTRGKGWGWRVENDRIRIEPNGLAFIGTGLFCDIPQGYEIAIRQLCGLTQTGLQTIDDTITANHRGEMYVIIHNISHQTQTLGQGDVIAEIVINTASKLEPDFR